MISASVVLSLVLFVCSRLEAQEPVPVTVDPVKVDIGFLPGVTEPAWFSWYGSRFEIHSAVADVAAGGLRAHLGGGELVRGDTPSAMRLEEVTRNVCLMIGERNASAGSPLQMGLMRCVDGVWRLTSSAVVNRIKSPFSTDERSNLFSRTELISWDEAASTAIVLVKQDIILSADQNGGQEAYGALLECRVALHPMEAGVPITHVPSPVGRFVAHGDSPRAYRRGKECLVTTVGLNTEGVDHSGRPRHRLNAWLRDESGAWRDLEVPPLDMEFDYSIAYAADGTLIVAMLVRSAGRVGLRTARWQIGQVERGFVLDDVELEEPVLSGRSVAWQATAEGPLPWAFDRRGAIRVR